MLDQVRRRRIQSYFTSRFQGRFSTDDTVLERYASDMSIYCLRPAVVIFPDDEEDISATLSFAREEGIPVAVRGGGTSTGGAAIGSGILVVISGVDGRCGPLARLSAVESRGTNAAIRAGAAVRHDDLQSALRQEGFFLPADPTSGAISYIGGNVSTRASGPHALRHGSIERYLRRIRFVTAQGDVVDTGRPDTIPSPIVKAVETACHRVLTDGDIRERISRTAAVKSASGYLLSTFLSGGGIGNWVTGLMAGQAGTLGVITEAELEAVPVPEGESTVLLGYADLEAACNAVGGILSTDPAAVEIMNGEALRIAVQKGRYPPDRAKLVTDASRHEALLLVEFAGGAAPDRAAALVSAVSAGGAGTPAEARAAVSPEERDLLWTIRKGLLPAVRSLGEHLRALSVVNDVGVPVERLAEFIRHAERCFRREGLLAPIYGHAGNGNLHLRPLFDIHAPDLLETVQRVADSIYGEVIRLGGTITGEHGMGRLRAPYLRGEWGDDVYRTMKDLKDAWDPEDILSPGCMFSDTPPTAVTGLEHIARR